DTVLLLLIVARRSRAGPPGHSRSAAELRLPSAYQPWSTDRSLCGRYGVRPAQTALRRRIAPASKGPALPRQGRSFPTRRGPAFPPATAGSTPTDRSLRRDRRVPRRKGVKEADRDEPDETGTPSAHAANVLLVAL